MYVLQIVFKVNTVSLAFINYLIRYFTIDYKIDIGSYLILIKRGVRTLFIYLLILIDPIKVLY